MPFPRFGKRGGLAGRRTGRKRDVPDGRRNLYSEDEASMSLKQLRRSFAGRLSFFIIVYLLTALLMYWIVADDWQYTAVETDSVSMGTLLPAGSEVSQTFTSSMDGLERVAIAPHFDEANPAGTVSLRISEGDTVLWSTTLACDQLTSDQVNEIEVTPYVSDVQGKRLTLTVQPEDAALALWSGTTMSAGKFDVSVATSGLRVNGEDAEGQLVMTVGGHNVLHAAALFWPVALALGLTCVAVAVITHLQIKKGRRTVLTVLADVCKRYGYLLKQLVWRDFRVKYKASVLGMLWSFLNPLLTMMVYYFVFSTLFRSDVEYFPVYLMSGIILFNFFSESTAQGLLAIVSNSSLITKVYMPKYIYPLSKVLSSALNLCISFIPLALVMIITGVPFTKSLLLLPWVILFLILFSVGMSLLLSAMNVFFRDTQFLWSVLITMWNFLTPIFYPESIIPARFITLYHLNPLYQIVYFMRSIVLGGVSPTPVTYIYCTAACLITLAAGLLVFRKSQDKFALYL